LIEHSIPGFGLLRLEHLVLDYNGTLALDGRLLPGVKTRLRALARRLQVHVLTADTFGTARRALAGTPCDLAVLGAARQDLAKARYVRRLGAARTACVGNGRNDRAMLRLARLGVAVMQGEGAAVQALVAADVAVDSIADALDLLLQPRRLTATLRS
jgi:soluble P-type ATPase